MPVTIIFSSNRSFVISFFLGFFTILDILFILNNFKKIKFNKLDFLFLLFLFFSIIIGFLDNELSRRFISDFLLPFNFILKLVIVRNGIGENKFSENFSWFVKKYIVVTFIAGAAGVAMFYLFKTGDFEYLGLTPVIYPKLILSLINGNSLFVIICFAVAFLSGKRAILIAAIGIVVSYLIFVRRRNKWRFAVPFILLGIGAFFIPKNESLSSSQAASKYTYTLQESKTTDLITLDKLTGGRFAEVESINRTMEPIDYILGKGIGFTYTFTRDGDVIAEEYGNAHFSPMSVVSKYGLFFFIILSIYLMKGVSQVVNKKRDFIFFAFFIIGCMIEYLFAYGVFIDKLMPLALGFLLSKPKPINA